MNLNRLIWYLIIKVMSLKYVIISMVVLITIRISNFAQETKKKKKRNVRTHFDCGGRAINNTGPRKSHLTMMSIKYDISISKFVSL